ncbi:MAG: hypothetical protein LBB53_06105 [Prevotellaceae bacterium]|nr:hypothetical protein [Prevotellaceae bacterium]
MNNKREHGIASLVPRSQWRFFLVIAKPARNFLLTLPFITVQTFFYKLSFLYLT